MIVEGGEPEDSYLIAVPPAIEPILVSVYPSPDGTWRKKYSHEVVLTGCRTVRAGDLNGASPADVWFWHGLRFERSVVDIVKNDLYPEHRYEKKATVPLLRDGEGPYCEFKVRGLPLSSGVYVFFVDGVLRYVGRAQSLSPRFYGYGHISPKNCYVGGQATNVRLNKKVRQAIGSGSEIEIFYHTTPDYIAVEASMINALQPPWNIQGINP